LDQFLGNWDLSRSVGYHSLVGRSSIFSNELTWRHRHHHS
jgi:hypothetical protein